MNIDAESSPVIWAIMKRYRPTHHVGHRFITIDRPGDLDREDVEALAQELARPGVAAALGSAEFATLALAAVSALDRLGGDAGVGDALRRLLGTHDGRIAADVALAAIGGHGIRRQILKIFPDLLPSPAMIDAIIEAASSGSMGTLESMLDVDVLTIGDLDQARRALSASQQRADDFLPTYLVAAAARGLGWTPWVKLFAILFDDPELADDDAPAAPPERRYNNGDAIRVREEAWDQIRPDLSVRRVARLLLDLEGVLSSSGPDVRAVFVERMRVAIGGDSDLRRAATEALLWRSPRDMRDLAIFAATRLVEEGDERFVTDLASHPDREVGYAADIVRSAVFGGAANDGAWPLPGVSMVSAGLVHLGLAPTVSEAPLTWIGDRLLERLIEQTIAGEERRFAAEYADHSEEGEEGLLKGFLSDLAQRFRSLDQGLRATVAATGATRSASVDLTYRPVDKSEEGKPGVNPSGEVTPPAFSADLCLIVDPYLDGEALGKRATLVQAKRLRLRDTRRPDLGLASSFKLDPAQMTDLMRQTDSSFYLFECSGLLGRGMPVIPTQLVEDLARRHAASAAQIPADLVGPASWSLAEWLTYLVLALRTGDPLAELVAKAEGGPGRRPRPLAKFGIVEIAIRVGEPKPRDG